MLRTINNAHKKNKIEIKNNNIQKLKKLICFILIGIAAFSLNLSGNTLQCYAEEGGYFEDGGGEVPGDYSGDSGGDSSGDSSGGSSSGASSSGYTPEQIAAAKAWLSSHGYAPTRAGASQAYQDYLDGKLDNDPDVRKYKGLDSGNNSNSTSSSTSGKPAGENVSEDTSKNTSENDSSNGQTNNGNTTGSQVASNESADVNFDDMTNIIDEEDAVKDSIKETDPKQELEDSIASQKSQLEIQSDDSEVMLVYDDYEKTEEELEKKNNKSKALMYLIISFIFLVIFLSMFKLLKNDKEF